MEDLDTILKRAGINELTIVRDNLKKAIEQFPDAVVSKHMLKQVEDALKERFPTDGC